MDLEERIARLIDPETWKTVDYLMELGVTGGPRHMGGAGSIEAARRVIDGLELVAQEVVVYTGKSHGPLYVAEKIEGTTPRVRYLTTEEINTIMKGNDGDEPYIHGDWT